MSITPIVLRIYLAFICLAVFIIYGFEITLISDLISYNFLLENFNLELNLNVSFSYTEPIFLFLFFFLSESSLSIFFISAFFGAILFFSLYEYTSVTLIKNRNIFGCLVLFLFLLLTYKIYPSLILIKQTIATSFLLLSLSFHSKKYMIIFLVLSILSHNMMIPLALFVLAIRYSKYLLFFLGFISLFTTLVMGQLTEIISDNEIYEIPKYYLIIDACLLIYIFVSRSFKEHHILFILLFTIVNASTVDLLSIRFEFILHIFRIAIIFEILNGFLKLDKINMNNLKPIVLSTLPLLAIFITSSIVSFKDF